MDPAVAAWRALPDVDEAAEFSETERKAILAGLRRMPQARISQVYLYDAAGSTLYDEITRTDEYYPTRTEYALLEECAAEIAVPADTDRAHQAEVQSVIELGAGAGGNTKLLLRALLVSGQTQRLVYAPIDVSAEGLAVNTAACKALASKALHVHPLLGPFEQRLPETSSLGGRKLYLFLGSSLGNFNDVESVALFALVARAMGSADRFVVGVDTPHSAQKPEAFIEAAYNDARGVTAAFTLNALRHINGIAGLDFAWRDGWRHVAEYRAHERAVVTFLEALSTQTVRTRPAPCKVAHGPSDPGEIGQFVRTFAAGECSLMV